MSSVGHCRFLYHFMFRIHMQTHAHTPSQAPLKQFIHSALNHSNTITFISDSISPFAQRLLQLEFVSLLIKHRRYFQRYPSGHTRRWLFKSFSILKCSYCKYDTVSNPKTKHTFSFNWGGGGGGGYILCTTVTGDLITVKSSNPGTCPSHLYTLKNILIFLLI